MKQPSYPRIQTTGGFSKYAIITQQLKEIGAQDDARVFACVKKVDDKECIVIERCED